MTPPSPSRPPGPHPEQCRAHPAPPRPGPLADPGITDYEDTDYGPNADGITDYEDTDYGPYSDGVTDYESPDDGAYVDGDTDYEDRDDGDDRGTTMTTTGTAMTMMMATMTESGMTTINAEKFPPRPRFWRPAAVSSLCQPKKRKKVFPRPRFFGSGSVI